MYRKILIIEWMPETGHWLYTWVGGGRDCKVRESRWLIRGHWGSREGISFTYRPGDAKMGESIRSEKMLVKVPPTTYILIIKKKIDKLYCEETSRCKPNQVMKVSISTDKIHITCHNTKWLVCNFKNASIKEKRNTKELYEIKRE